MGVSVTWKSALWIGVGKQAWRSALSPTQRGFHESWLAGSWTSLQPASIPLASHVVLMIQDPRQSFTQYPQPSDNVPGRTCNGCTALAWSDAGSFLPSIRLLVRSVSCRSVSLTVDDTVRKSQPRKGGSHWHWPALQVGPREAPLAPASCILWNGDTAGGGRGHGPILSLSCPLQPTVGHVGEENFMLTAGPTSRVSGAVASQGKLSAYDQRGLQGSARRPARLSWPSISSGGARPANAIINRRSTGSGRAGKRARSSRY